MSATGRGPELLEAGPPPPSPTARRRQWMAFGLAFVMLAVLGGLWWRRTQATASAPPPSASASSVRPSPSPRPVSFTRRPGPSAPVVLRRTGPRLDGLGAGDLFVRTTETLYRVGLADGRVTATPADVGISAPVTFLAGPSQVLLRPLDQVPGLRVPDDRPAAELNGLLRRSTVVLPGGSGRVWVGESFDGERSTLTLLSFDGVPTGFRVQERGAFTSDGSGGLLLQDNSGVRELRDGRWRLVTRGRVLAVGPGHYLFSACAASRPCITSRYDRRTRTSVPVPADQAQLFGGSGSLSADGRYVAAMSYGPDGAGIAEVVDLVSGLQVASFAEPNASADIASVAAWSPDGHHLAALDDGRLVLLDPATGRRTDPDLDLPTLVGLALRPG